ncbi:PQQ-dependent sugar dehydrogenase [Neptunicella sp. SCSIO 80796]|uniref:PQQ-dependent sugar dehydrogenase n=1 Tax=Neptunicella plasticusilytica TaxID=3117012 RepID=UPI003A4D821C
MLRLLVVFLLATLLQACGGSSSDSATDNPPLPELPVLQVANISQQEGNNGETDFIFSLTATVATNNNISVEFSSEDDSALAASDYQSASGTATINAGQTRTDIVVKVLGDEEVEQDESFKLVLSNAQGATLGTAIAVATIVNDDQVELISGLEQRPDNSACLATEAPVQASSVEVVEAFNALPLLSQPTKLLKEPGAGDRWFVLEKTGKIKVFSTANPDQISTFMDLSDLVNTASEGGLLGMAFHPDYPQSAEIFLSYTTSHSNPSMRSVISRWQLDDLNAPQNPVEQVILNVDQYYNNHNGGDIAFGPDNMLYIGFGDGGSGGDPDNRAQDTRYLLGSMLRIDVLHPDVSYPQQPYVIPQNNPFADNPRCGAGSNQQSCPEIYAWGLRNPWRWSFDWPSGDLWLADVGQNAYEEVNKIHLGGNYGWRCKEAFAEFNQTGCNANYIDPLTAYGRSEGNSITGGYVYRGNALPALVGQYIFADYGSGRIWALQHNGEDAVVNKLLVDTSFGISSFALDDSGELYFTDLNGGRIYRLDADSGNSNPVSPIPEQLSDTGCVNMANPAQAANGTIPYQVNMPFWSDGADKSRFVALPNQSRIDFSEQGRWQFPVGSVLVKHFQFNQRWIETRLLMHHTNGQWAGYLYEWNTSQTEAYRVRGGKTLVIDDQPYRLPAEVECLTCHTSAAEFTLGLETAQLNGDMLYPSTNINANQLATFAHIGMFNQPLNQSPEQLPVLVSTNDQQASLDNRARSYLHSNCAGCHRQNGPTAVDLDLRYELPLAQTHSCDIAPQSGELGISNARIIAPGDAQRSVLLNRISRRDAYAMPPIGSHRVDQQGSELIGQWINGLADCG